jgi:hypothetical protein
VKADGVCEKCRESLRTMIYIGEDVILTIPDTGLSVRLQGEDLETRESRSQTPACKRGRSS